MVAPIDTNIWDRIVQQSWSDLDAPAANALLRLKFSSADLDRMDELSRKAQAGSLTESDRANFEQYLRIGNMLAVLQSRARQALKQKPAHTGGTS